MTADPHATQSFQDVLNLLLEAQAIEDPHKPGLFVVPTNAEVADAINAKFGPGTITGEYIRRLRKGDIKSPSVQTASLLAGFFGLPLDVFNAAGSETSQKVVEEVQRFLAHRRRMLSDETSTVAGLARTSRRLSPEGQQRLLRYAERLGELEDMEREADAPLAPASD